MAADPQDIPEGTLRDIAYRVPADCRAMQSTLELQLRCEWVHELQCRAASEPPDKAERTLKLAEKVIRSLSDYSYSAEQADLSAALTAAQQRQDSQGTALALQDLNALSHRHPRLPTERAVAHAAGVVAKEIDRPSIPSAPYSRLFRGSRDLRK
jgi:hypothetical protein